MRSRDKAAARAARATLLQSGGIRGVASLNSALDDARHAVQIYEVSTQERRLALFNTVFAHRTVYRPVADSCCSGFMHA